MQVVMWPREYRGMRVLSPLDLLFERSKSLPISDTAWVLLTYFAETADCIDQDGMSASGKLPSATAVAKHWDIPVKDVQAAATELMASRVLTIVLPSGRFELGIDRRKLISPPPSATRGRSS